ncbi:MAG: hypothetical protein GYA21_06090, partial [Myxococcales bacterium]|nr:hypothetical protein [Myxococcales bacterium]
PAAAPVPQYQRPPAPPPLSPSPLNLPPAPAITRPLPPSPAVSAALAAAAPGKEQHEQSTPLDALSGQGVPALTPPAPPASSPPAPSPASSSRPASLTPNLDKLAGEAFVSVASTAEIRSVDEAPAQTARGVSAIRAQSGRPVVRARDEFKVRTQQGLLYDFPSRDALLRWLADRDDTESCQVGTGGDQWMGAAAFLARESAAAATSQVRVAPPLYSPPAALAAATSAPPRPSRLPLWLWLAFGLSTLVLVVAVAATLTRYGLFDASRILPLDTLGVHFPEQPERPQGEIPPAANLDPEPLYARAMGEAQQALRGKRFSRAALEFNRALGVKPGSREALEGLVKAYQGLGDRDRAQAAEKKLRQVLPP